jgi:5-(aminomethyl)-3-furanmethanol phosphate kinase
MWVIKLGGSLASDPRLPGCLQMLATLGGGRVTVVPGGGGFADQVRHAQAHWHFDDLAAHNMAVLGMAQMAQMLHGIEPRLPLVDGEAGIREALRSGRSALWQPLSLLRQAPDELTSWDVSSDSLALWLARRLNAERLVVLKACSVDPALGFEQLAELGVLDRRFAGWARDAAFPIEVLSCSDIDALRSRLVGGDAPVPGPAPGQPLRRRWRRSARSAGC